MVFRQTEQFCFDLESALEYYLEVDPDLASGFLEALESMEAHLSMFPESAPFTKLPPIRKYLMKRFPYRVSYSVETDEIILLTLENMSQNKPL